MLLPLSLQLTPLSLQLTLLKLLPLPHQPTPPWLRLMLLLQLPQRLRLKLKQLLLKRRPLMPLHRLQ
jgi:hypothetical protein